MPNHNSHWRNSPDTRIRQQWVGAEQGGMGCMLRVRTRPECPEDNLRELTWDSNPNCGIARERERENREREREQREREIENFLVKSSNLRHCQAPSQNKGLSQYQKRASWLWTGPSPAGGREAKTLWALPTLASDICLQCTSLPIAQLNKWA